MVVPISPAGAAPDALAPARSLQEQQAPPMNGTDATFTRLPGRSRYSVSFL